MKIELKMNLKSIKKNTVKRIYKISEFAIKVQNIKSVKTPIIKHNKMLLKKCIVKKFI